MQTTEPITAAEQSDVRQRKLSGRPWPPGTSGNLNGRGSMNKRAAALFEVLSADFCGADTTLSAIDRALLEQACRLLVRAERECDADAAVRLTSEARRGLMALRRHGASVPREEPMASEVLRARYSGTASLVDEPESEAAVEAADDESRTAVPSEGRCERS
jgi:hypothetical protein